MSSFLRRISTCFAAGCIGAVVSTWLAWRLGSLGIPQKLGVALAPGWSMPFLYRQVVLGGLWGFLFAVPLWRRGFRDGVFSRGILFSLIPAMVQLLYVLPFLEGKGMFGLKLGALTPAFVIFYSAVWGLCTGLWLYAANE
jgi:hypothetical protein